MLTRGNWNRSIALNQSASAGRTVVEARGAAGEVFLCHPFLVHAASWPHRGVTPRMITQPGVGLLEPFPLSDRNTAYPVEAAILDATVTR